jgi:DNA-directed RNA polymerase I subunit RPA1
MVWLSDPDFLTYLFPVLCITQTQFPTDLFFVDVVAVPPPKNRAARMVNNMVVEHPQNLALRHIITSITMLQYASMAMKNGIETLSPEALKALKGITGKSINEKIETIWKDLQADVDHVMDREKSKISSAAASQMLGLKQVIEKKEGLFRMHMMGKRVNYAARTVITPDPTIHIEEIGIPDVFAKVLTFPTQVTSWNVQHLRQLVLNGPNVHPG